MRVGEAVGVAVALADQALVQAFAQCIGKVAFNPKHLA